MVKKKDKFKKIAVPKRNRRKPPKLTVPVPASAPVEANQLPQDASELSNNNNDTPQMLVPGMLVSGEHHPSGITNAIPSGAVVFQKRKKKKKKKKKKKDKSIQQPEDSANQEWVPSEGEEEEILQSNQTQEDEDNLDDDEAYEPSELEQELLNLADREDRPRRTYNMPELSAEEALERSLRRRTNARGTPKSDYLGVSWCNRKQLWHGRIWLKQEKRLVWIGYYADQVECAKAVNKACVEHNIPIKNPNLPL